MLFHQIVSFMGWEIQMKIIDKKKFNSVFKKVSYKEYCPLLFFLVVNFTGFEVWMVVHWEM